MFCQIQAMKHLDQLTFNVYKGVVYSKYERPSGKFAKKPLITRKRRIDSRTMIIHLHCLTISEKLPHPPFQDLANPLLETKNNQFYANDNTT